MIGIDISDRSIKVVQLSQGDSRRLLAYCSGPLPDGSIVNGVIQDKAVVQKALLEAMTQCRIGPKTKDVVVASIPETQSFLRVIEVPQMDNDELSEAVRWEVAQHIPFGIDNVYMDWQDLSGGSRNVDGVKREVQVGATQKQVVDGLYEVLQILELDVAAFELESQALVRAVISPELRERRGVLIVDLGASATNVVVHDHGAMRFTATLQKGIEDFLQTISPKDGDMVRSRLHELERGDMDRLGDMLLPVMVELATEIRGIVEFYNSVDVEHEVEEIIMTGGGSNLPALDQAFLQYFDNVHVQRGNPWVNILPRSEMTRPPMDLRQSVRFTTALGLSLRNVLR